MLCCFVWLNNNRTEEKHLVISIYIIHRFRLLKISHPLFQYYEAKEQKEHAQFMVLRNSNQ